MSVTAGRANRRGHRIGLYGILSLDPSRQRRCQGNRRAGRKSARIRAAWGTVNTTGADRRGYGSCQTVLAVDAFSGSSRHNVTDTFR